MKQLTLALAVVVLGSTARAADDTVSYQKKIVPILEKRCVSCHGLNAKKKPKAKLRLDIPAMIKKGSEDGVIFVAGQPEKSKMYKRIILPKGHDDIMPSKGDPLTKDQIALIKKWIEQGAKFDGPGLATTSAPKESGPLFRKAAVADEKALAKLKALGALAMPLAKNTNLISVSFIGGSEKLKDADLALLKPVTEQLVWLNLAGTKVTDAGLKHLAGLKFLTRLHLEKTGVGDAGLASLKGMPDLAYLNLYGTKVTDGGLANLKGLKNLKKLYVWQTKVSKKGADDLAKAVSGIYINRGEELTKVPPPAPPKPTVKAINTKCPFTGKAINASATFTYKGQVIAFCCNNCLGKFKKEPAKLIAKVKEFKAAPAPKKAAPAAKAGAPIDGEGFIRAWLVLAPIPSSVPDNGFEEIDKEQIKNEAKLAPKAGDKVKVGGKELAWKAHSPKDFFVDFRESFGGDIDGQNAVAYAVAYVDAPAAMKGVKLQIGSNDQAKVYLNGKQVLAFTETRTLEKDQDGADVALRKGRNVVILKVVNEQNDWQGCLRFTKGGKPVRNLKVSTSSGKAATAKAPINAKCPFTKKALNPKCFFDYKGQRIGFCCGKCLARFKKNPAKEIARVKEFKK